MTQQQHPRIFFSHYSTVWAHFFVSCWRVHNKQLQAMNDDGVHKLTFQRLYWNTDLSFVWELVCKVCTVYESKCYNTQRYHAHKMKRQTENLQMQSPKAPNNDRMQRHWCNACIKLYVYCATRKRILSNTVGNISFQHSSQTSNFNFHLKN